MARPGGHIEEIDEKAKIAIMNTIAKKEKFLEEREQKRLENARKEEERQAWLKTPEGILKTRQEEEWFGGELVIKSNISEDYKRVEVRIIVNEREVGSVTVTQRQNWETKKFNKPQINWGGYGDRSAEVAKLYAEAITRASEIAKEMEEGN